jgi:hypothetical protein
MPQLGGSGFFFGGIIPSLGQAGASFGAAQLGERPRGGPLDSQMGRFLPCAAGGRGEPVLPPGRVERRSPAALGILVTCALTKG